MLLQNRHLVSPTDASSTTSFKPLLSCFFTMHRLSWRITFRLGPLECREFILSLAPQTQEPNLTPLSLPFLWSVRGNHHLWWLVVSGTSPTAPVEVVKLAKGAPRPCYVKYYHINIRSTYVFPSKSFNLTRQMEHFPNLLNSFDIHCTSGKRPIENIWKGGWPFRKKGD